MSKKLIHLLRHKEQVHRDDDGAIAFWRIKENLQNQFLHCPHWSDDSGRKAWQEEEEETRKDISIVLIHHEQSCTSELFKVIQDAVSVIPIYRQCCYSEQLLPIHLSCRMCNRFAFHYQFEIDTGRSTFGVFFLLVGSHGTKTIRILIRSTCENHAMHNICIKSGRKHQNMRCIGSISILL